MRSMCVVSGADYARHWPGGSAPRFAQRHPSDAISEADLYRLDESDLEPDDDDLEDEDLDDEDDDDVDDDDESAW